MRTTLAPLIAAAFLGLFTSLATATNEPIPGIDIIIKKNPGGIVTTTTTGKDGTFVFARLTPGKYGLSVASPQTKASVNTSRSNIKRPGISVKDGVETASVAVTLGTDAPAPVEIEFTRAGATITGTVTRADAPKTTDAKQK